MGSRDGELARAMEEGGTVTVPQSLNLREGSLPLKLISLTKCVIRKKKCVWVCVCVCECVRACVRACVRERERERERGGVGGDGGGRDRLSSSDYCTCSCVF